MQINAQYRNIRRAEPKGMIAPWTGTGVRVDEVLLAERKDKYSVEELRRKTMERIQQGPEGIHIYTDGSTDGNQEKGGEGVYIGV